MRRTPIVLSAEEPHQVTRLNAFQISSNDAGSIPRKPPKCLMNSCRSDLGRMLPRDGCGVGPGRLGDVGPSVPGLEEPSQLRVGAVAATNTSAGRALWGYPLEGELTVWAVGESPLPISQRRCAGVG